MSISTRRRLGLLLACISALAFIGALAFFLHSGVFVVSVGSVGSDLNWRFFLTLTLLGVGGVCCLVLAQRKPPKL